MVKLYRIEARPFWNHWYTGASFTATALILGSILLSVVGFIFGGISPAFKLLFLSLTGLGLLLESVGLIAHARSLQSASSEGAASFYLQTTKYGYAYWLRNALLVFALITCGVMLLNSSSSIPGYSLLALLSLATLIISRALFYVVVIPTTMPGAFFWKNEGFVEHARETGLADMPQMGVAYEHHHAFKLDELIETIKTTSFKEKVAQLHRVFSG